MEAVDWYIIILGGIIGWLAYGRYRRYQPDQEAIHTLATNGVRVGEICGRRIMVYVLHERMGEFGLEAGLPELMHQYGATGEHLIPEARPVLRLLFAAIDEWERAGRPVPPELDHITSWHLTQTKR